MLYDPEKERGRILASRIETANLVKRITEERASTPAGKARIEKRKLDAERAKLHAKLGTKLADTARQLQEQTPGMDLSTAYIRAGKAIGLHV